MKPFLLQSTPEKEKVSKTDNSTTYPAFSDVIDYIVTDDIAPGTIGVSEGVGAHWVATQSCHSTLHHHITIHLRVDVLCLQRNKESRLISLLPTFF